MLMTCRQVTLATVLLAIAITLSGCFGGSSGGGLDDASSNQTTPSPSSSSSSPSSWSSPSTSPSESQTPSCTDGWCCNRPSPRRLATAGLARKLGSDTEKQYDYAYVHEDGLSVRVHYNVDVDDDVEILPLANLKDVTSLVCTDVLTLLVSFTSKPSADAFGAQLEQVKNGTRLYLSSVSVESCNEGPFVARVQTFDVVSQGFKIVYANANYEDVFRHASVRFSTDLAQGPDISSQPVNAAPSHDGRALFFGFATVLDAAWSATRGFANSVVKELTPLLELAGDVMDAAFNGNLDAEYSKEVTLFSLSCNGQIASAGGAALEFTEVSGALTATLGFAMKIESHELLEAGVSVEGKLELIAEAKASQTMEYSTEKLIFAFRSKLPPLFVLGIPIVIDLEAPVNVGFVAKFEGSVTARQSMSGSIKFAYNYQPQSEEPHTRSFTQSFEAESSVQVKSEASIQVYTKVAPTVWVYKIFGVVLALKPYVLATSDNFCSVQKFIGLDADVSFEAKGIAKKEFPNVLALQKPWGANSADECNGRRLGLRGLATSMLGRMWEGSITRSVCYDGGYPAYESGKMQLQLVDGSNQVYMGVVNLDQTSGISSNQGGGQCSITMKFEVVGIALQPVQDANFWASCGSLSFYDLRFLLNWGSENDAIAGYSDNGCHKLDLQVVAPVTSGKLSD
ncbi:unnamed protein product [Effrenium voratum]|nr:unnamed protein product [Effrenium voratum]